MDKHGSIIPATGAGRTHPGRVGNLNGALEGRPLQMPRPLVTVEWLAAHLRDPGLAILDCRYDSLGDPAAGRMAHAEDHIPGAIYFHLDEDLSGPAGEHGGRHPLPGPGVIARKLGAAGVGEGVRVVAYDWTGEHAARCWWVLRWLGHDEVAVLDGGYHAWRRAGQPVETAPPRPRPRLFTPRPRPEMVASVEEVAARPPDTVVVDARAPDRFAGQPHPLDAKQGHIPGAVNRFWQDALRPDGTYRPADEQRARFAGLPLDGRLIHQCGSGVTACVNALALELAGARGTRLYVGSWSDWCSYPDKPVEK